jgi:hypothetical protein
MERSHGRELQVMSGAPFKKLPASSSVSSPSVPVADRGSEEVNVGFSDSGPAAAISSGIHAFFNS